MSAYTDKVRDAAKELVRNLFLREPSRGAIRIVAALTCLFLIASLWSLLMGAGGSSWLLQLAFGGGTFLLFWLSFMVHGRHRTLSALLSLVALLLAILFFVLATTGTL